MLGLVGFVSGFGVFSPKGSELRSILIVPLPDGLDDGRSSL